MESVPPTRLEMPSFLHGIYPWVRRSTRAQGWRCAKQYLKDGSFPAPRQMKPVPPGEVVVLEGGVDFQREHPAWRLYGVADVVSTVCEALDWQNTRQVSAAYEASFRDTAWGALFFAVGTKDPRTARRTASRLQAVVRFWESLGTVRYLFNTYNIPLSLEELMALSCGWAMDAWCPVAEGSVRHRLEVAAERMARATREESMEVILRQLPRCFMRPLELKHRTLLADPAFQRQRLATLAPDTFERISGACPADLVGQIVDWDYQLGLQ